MKKYLFLILISLFILSGCPGSGTSFGGIFKFNTSRDIVSYNGANGYDGIGLLGGTADAAPEAGADDANYTPTSGETSRSVTEPEIYCFAGDRLFIANERKGLMVLDIADPDNPAILGEYAVEGTPQEMYDSGSEIVMLVNPSLYWGASESQDTEVLFFDRGGTTMEPLHSVGDLEGRIVDSRKVGDVVYLVLEEEPNWYSWSDYGQADDTVEGDVAVFSDGADIGVDSSTQPAENARVVAIDVTTHAVAGTREFSGYNINIHVTDSRLFASVTEASTWNRSIINAYDISDPAGGITELGSITLNGTVQDRFKLYYSGGYLRAVTHNWGEDEPYTTVCSVDWNDAASPQLLDTLQIGYGDMLHASRFSGDYGFIVTFEQVDPLYMISFADPAAIEEITNLDDIPGWFTHLEVRGDILFGIGVDGENGAKAGTFDFSSGDSLIETDTVSLISTGDAYGYSSANWDYKRLNWIDALDAYGVPVQSFDPETRSNESGVVFVRVAADGTLSVPGRVDHPGDVKRTMAVDADTLYTYSDSRLQSVNFTYDGEFTTVSTLTLLENVENVLILDAATGVKLTRPVDQYWYNQSVTIHTFPLSDYDQAGGLGAAEAAPDARYSDGNGYTSLMTDKAFIVGAYLYLPFTAYDYEDWNQQSTGLIPVDLNDPVAPSVGDSIEFYSGERLYAYNGVASLHADRPLKLNDSVVILELNNRLEAWDFSAPTVPVRVQTLVDGRLAAWFVEGETLYATSETEPDADGYFISTLTAWDISAPAAISQRYSVAAPGTTLARRGDRFLSFYLAAEHSEWPYLWKTLTYYYVVWTYADSDIQVLQTGKTFNLPQGLYVDEDVVLAHTGWFYDSYYGGIYMDYAAEPAVSRDIEATGLITFDFSGTLTVVEVAESPGSSWSMPQVIPAGDRLALVSNDAGVVTYAVSETGSLTSPETLKEGGGVYLYGTTAASESHLYHAAGEKGVLRTGF